MSAYQEKYPHLWAFFDGAFSINSGGHADARNFEGFTEVQLIEAEQELREFTFDDMKISRFLGSQADSGYTIWGQTHQEDPDGDDDQHKLEAFTLLDTFY